MEKLKIISIGDNFGVILPVEILEKHCVKKGDVVYLVESPNGIELTSYNPDISEQIAVADWVMLDDRETLKVLAN